MVCQVSLKASSEFAARGQRPGRGADRVASSHRSAAHGGGGETKGVSKKSKANFKRVGRKKPRVRGGLSGAAVAKGTKKRGTLSGGDGETEQVTKRRSKQLKA